MRHERRRFLGNRQHSSLCARQAALAATANSSTAGRWLLPTHFRQNTNTHDAHRPGSHTNDGGAAGGGVAACAAGAACSTTHAAEYASRRHPATPAPPLAPPGLGRVHPNPESPPLPPPCPGSPDPSPLSLSPEPTTSRCRHRSTKSSCWARAASARPRWCCATAKTHSTTSMSPPCRSARADGWRGV